jgi:tRNA pseudouridine32 synthase / 23S rRNA pseudouridine746 synthase
VVALAMTDAADGTSLWQPLPDSARCLALPLRMPSPFAAPHPVAIAAARHLMARLAGAAPALTPLDVRRGDGDRDDQGDREGEDDTSGGARPRRGATVGDSGAHAGEGKMLGVLVVRRDDGELGYLSAFSGMWHGRWLLDGFVPPLFELTAREPWWSEAQLQLRAWDVQLGELTADGRLAALRRHGDALTQQHQQARQQLRAEHAERRQQRRARRAELRAQPPSPAGDAVLHALAQESRRDGAALRWLEDAQRRQRAAARTELAALEDAARQLGELRARSSAQFQRRLHDLYLRDDDAPAGGLRALFAPAEPPSGTGDCAGAKLVGYARRQRLRPIALAELWWGAPPLGGGRHHGQLYPACRGKCGPLLPHLLRGVDVEPAPRFGLTSPAGGAAPDADAGGKPTDPTSRASSVDHAAAARKRAPARDRGLEVWFEDDWLVVIAKPCGLLSVPGREPGLEDSVLQRLRARCPRATGPLLVHRLDLDTSGLLLAAKDPASHTALQRQFTERTVDKRYAAILDGEVRGERGEIALALRPDLDDRPRQLHDPVHGKPALTLWQVVARGERSTRVELSPRTGRTHQLRVHAAHPLGLAAPIAGDRLYGRGEGRLMLHAESLALAHPRSGERVALRWPAPF